MIVVLDTSVLVGLIDARDALHRAATDVRDALEDVGAALLLLDCVVVETVGVICRRRAERRAKQALPAVRELFPRDAISHAYSLLERSWNEILQEVSSSDGRLNPHDALILAYARAESVDAIASFDVDLAGRGVVVFRKPGDVRAHGRE